MYSKMNFQKRNKRRINDYYIYSDCLITRTIKIPIVSIGRNINETIKRKISDDYEGKCVVEGFIKPNSCEILTYSSGLLRSDYVIYEVVFKCETCFPVEGMLINCIAVNITKAGIRAEIYNMKPTPAIVFITRDHHYNNEQFSKIKEGDQFVASVIGQRFELNDKFVSIIAKLKSSSEEKIREKKKTEKAVIINDSPTYIKTPKKIEEPTLPIDYLNSKLIQKPIVETIDKDIAEFVLSDSESEEESEEEQEEEQGEGDKKYKKARIIDDSDSD